ncbi:DUF2953 domain-containing protein [Cohnella sp.]|uniref:DUF2953 domain-containing protein n=1 Tax=Cohnella sp. TaxID=1883426 RepID=UPI0035673B22
MAFWLWIVLAIVVVIIAGVLLSRVRIRLRYSRSGHLDQLVVVVQALYGLFHYQIIVPSIMIRGWNIVYREKSTGGLMAEHEGKQKKGEISKRTIRHHAKAYRSILQTTREFKRWALETLKKIECTRWRLDFQVGTGDAAVTAVITGLLWAVSGCAAGAAGEIVTLKTSPQSRVSPNYSGTEFTVVWEADFRIRLTSMLWSFIKLGKRTIRLSKALKAWRSWLTGPEQA